VIFVTVLLFVHHDFFTRCLDAVQTVGFFVFIRKPTTYEEV